MIGLALLIFALIPTSVFSGFCANKLFFVAFSDGLTNQPTLCQDQYETILTKKLPIKLADQDVVLDLNLSSILSPIHLNEGSLQIKKRIFFKNKALLFGPGRIIVENQELHLQELLMIDDLFFQGQGQFIQHANLEINHGTKITILNDSSFYWDGQGNVLEFANQASLNCQSSGKIVFTNVLLKTKNIEDLSALKQENIFFKNVCWEIDSEANFIKNTSLKDFVEAQAKKKTPRAKEDVFVDLSENLLISNKNPLVFDTPNNFVVNGGYHKIIFTEKFNKLVYITNNANVLFKNCDFINFDLDSIVLAKSCAINFGENNNIFLENNSKLTEQHGIIISGNTSFWGRKQSFLLGEKSCLVLQASADLKLINLRVEAQNPESIMAVQNSKLTLQNCDFFMGEGGFCWQAGELCCEGKIKVFQAESSNNQNFFFYNSPSALKILENSVLKMTVGTTLSFAANPETVIKPKFCGPNSKLSLNFARLDITGKKFFLDTGALNINHKSTIFAAQDQPAEFHLLNPARVITLSNSRLIFKNVKCFEEASMMDDSKQDS